MMKPHHARMLAVLMAITVFLSMISAPAAAQYTAVPFRVYMTFEDGPTEAYTPGILDTLAAHGARATFLIGGSSIAGHEALIQRELREGHAIINHLWQEPGAYAGAEDAVVLDSYVRTEEAIRAALAPEPALLAIYDAQQRMFWQPGGGARPLPVVEGMPPVITYNWNVNSDDCGWGMPASVDLNTLDFDEAVMANVLGMPVQVPPFHNPYNAYDYGDGVIIAFHDINRVTGRVLPQIMEALQAAGAVFEALPRPWDVPGSMPVLLAVPPDDSVPGVTGYTAAATTRVTSRIRALPSLSADVIGSVPAGTSWTAIGRADGWIEVQMDGGSGWIARELLDVYGAIPNLPRLPA